MNRLGLDLAALVALLAAMFVVAALPAQAAQQPVRYQLGHTASAFERSIFYCDGVDPAPKAFLLYHDGQWTVVKAGHVASPGWIVTSCTYFAPQMSMGGISGVVSTRR